MEENKTKVRNILEFTAQNIYEKYFAGIPLLFLVLFVEKRLKEADIIASVSVCEEGDHILQSAGLSSDVRIVLNPNGFLDFKVKGEEPFTIECKKPVMVEITGLNPEAEMDTTFCRSFIGKKGYLLTEENGLSLIYTEGLRLDPFFFNYRIVEDPNLKNEVLKFFKKQLI